MMEAIATLILSDGTSFTGQSFGADTNADGEVVFNTGMVGYNESLTDPSYRGQILTFTYPLIGNYGVPSEEINEYGFSKNFESEDIHVRAVICSQVSEHYSHHEAAMSFPEWLKKHNIPGITGVDTRALTKKLREKGVMLGRVVQEELKDSSFQESKQDQSVEDQSQKMDIKDPNLENLVAEVSCSEVVAYESPLDTRCELRSCATRGDTEGQLTIVAYDCGIKRNILRSFLKRGVKVIRVPWNFNLQSADFKYDGVFISNGPGDPKMCTETINQVRWAVEQGIPTFGICLGNQILALAMGDDYFKMKYGHRGANQPCVELNQSGEKTDRCIITSQNHGFAIKGENLPAGWHTWWVNANDGTAEGIRHESGKFFSVQFHPEATPGPEDANYLFDEFLAVVKMGMVAV